MSGNRHGDSENEDKTGEATYGEGAAPAFVFVELSSYMNVFSGFNLGSDLGFDLGFHLRFNLGFVLRFDSKRGSHTRTTKVKGGSYVR